jgi:hypothetical protein
MRSEGKVVAIPPIQAGEGLANLAFTRHEDQRAMATRAAQEVFSEPQTQQPAMHMYVGSQDQSLGQVYASRTGIVPRMFAASELRKDYERQPGERRERDPDNRRQEEHLQRKAD